MELALALIQDITNVKLPSELTSPYQITNYEQSTFALIIRWIASIQFPPGLSLDVLKFIQHNHTENSDTDKVCIIGFDEMGISQQISYCPTQDQIFGPYKKVQVLSVRGLLSSWKYPVFFGFDTKMTEELILHVITTLHEYGLIVKGKFVQYF